MTMPKLVVAADARVAFDEVPRGIGKTVCALYKSLAAIRPDWRFHLFCRSRGSAAAVGFPANVSIRPIEMPGDRFGLWDRVRLPVAVAASRPDVVHALAGVAPTPCLVPVVATVYDLIPIDPLVRDADAVRWGRRVRATVSRARVVVVNSHHVRARVIEKFRVDPGKVRLVPWAPLGTSAVEGRATVLARYGVDPARRYVLHFGMRDPRKNTLNLLAEWRRLPLGLRESVPLVVVGVDDLTRERFRAHADATVTLTGYVPEADARALLAHAAVLAYPSSDEGFGMPMVDAFAAGVPVVAGRAGAVIEVAGGAAEVADPATPGDLAGALRKLLESDELCRTLADRGRFRAAELSWERTAGGFARAFEDAARGNHARRSGHANRG